MVIQMHSTLPQLSVYFSIKSTKKQTNVNYADYITDTGMHHAIIY